MTGSNLAKEQARLHGIAQQYKDLGYTVAVSPSPKQLPEFLSRFRPDLVAKGPNESVVVEIKWSNKTRGAKYWKDLTRAVKEHPGWRLEFIVKGVRADRKAKTLGKEAIHRRLLEGRRLAEDGLLAASLLIFWSAAEAAMRIEASRLEIDLPDLRPATIISRLYTDGAFDKQEYDFLLDCMRLRNAVAHGFDEGRIKPGALNRLEKLTSRLLR